MRLTNKHDYKNYLANKRIAVIQKARHRTYTLIQFTNNRLIDKKITEWNNEYSTDVYDPYKEENIQDEIHHYNLLASQKDLQRILSMLCFLHSSIISWKPGLISALVPVIPGSLNTFTNLQDLFA